MLNWQRHLRSSAKVQRVHDPEKTHFCSATLGGVLAKPRAEVHPLLTAFEGMQQDEVSHQTTFESALLAQQLDELRWGEQRRGAWTAPPERRPPGDEAKLAATQQKGQPRTMMAPARSLMAVSIAKASKKDGKKDIHGDADAMERLIDLLDPEHTGAVHPDVFVPLMFWLGLTRRRAAALTTLELAFGEGMIDTSHLRNLSKYADVQIRLIDGLRLLARRESLEQLCEYTTDMIRLRTWFHTMKCDTAGHVEIGEVQNLFARMEVTSDRQALFRFLNHVAHSDRLPPAAVHKGEGNTKAASVGFRINFSMNDFASLICRCSMAWCLHRTMIILNPTDNSLKLGDTEGPILMPAADLDREAGMRWVALQRKIIVSLLVNHRFWGRESRTVLMSLSQPQFTTLGNQLSPEQWLSLFQRVRAQGIASTLPADYEAEYPDWFRKKAYGAVSLRRVAASDNGLDDRATDTH
jgi:hypothetical protein